MDPTGNLNPIRMEETTASKRRRKKSIVWDHFTVETMPNGCTRACCNLCKQTFAYNTGAKLSGTSHLKRHIIMGSCPVIREQKKKAWISGAKVDANTDPPKRRYRSRVNYLSAFDQERSMSELSKMIIMHDYPLHMVEHSSFICFVQCLQPEFKVPDIGVIEAEILGVYHKEKQNLSSLLETVPGRLSLTICLWSTNQTLGYFCMMGYFIDNDWKLHQRMLNFMMVSSPHSENALSEAIEFSLSNWDAKSKLFTITLDNNCSSHDIYSANLRDHLSNKNNLMLKGEIFVVRCYAHILNMVAQDLITSIHGTVYSIRESVKYVKASVVSEEKFVDIAHQLQVSTTKTLSLDIQTQWDTTYLMLASALDFRHAFACLETCDPYYNEAPSADDWKKVEIVCTYLKVLYESANVITGTVCPTSNIYFHEASKIQQLLKNAVLNEDIVTSSITKELHEKFDKYWSDCNLVLAIAVIMDPRFKLKLVEFTFSKIYCEDASRYIKVVNDKIHDLFHEYVGEILVTPVYQHQEGGSTANGNGAEANTMYENNVQANHVYANNNDVNNHGENAVHENVYQNNVDTDHAFEHGLEAHMFTIENIKSENIEAHDVKFENDESNGLGTTNGTDHFEVDMSGIDYNMSIVDEYNSSNGDIHDDYVDDRNNCADVGTFSANGLLDFDMYISEMAVTQNTKSELDQYLEEALVPRVENFDILHWWRLNTVRFPTLSKMARDILSIPMSTMSSGTMFSKASGSRSLDEYKSSLRPEIVEALFCCKDWLQHASAPLTAETPSADLEMEI